MISYLAMLVACLLLDAAVRPRAGGLGRIAMRRWQGIVLNGLSATALFGLWQAACGSAPVAAILTVAVMAVLVIASNAKHAVLGEPLLFSDMALIASVFRHPRFYLTAVSARAFVALAIGLPLLLFVIAWLFVREPMPHLVGGALLLAASGALFALLRSPVLGTIGAAPAIDEDVARYGLPATLLIYWRRWRVTPDPPPCPALSPLDRGGGDQFELIIVVQCESFADPVELTGDPGHALPGLAFAREHAWQWGHLAVSGFGAYTMRTEFGVLFGRSEAELGFRRYDPFLTAHGETSYALPARIAPLGYRSLFVHPHDMRFYGRDRLMPAIGFGQLIGEDAFGAVGPDRERYVDDRTLGAALEELIAHATEPTLIYAVTMENHGPWGAGGLGDYLRHLRSSDAMLTGLMQRIAATARPALLVFFGDHRPSLPGVTEPLGDRHTPYVMMRYAGGVPIKPSGDRRADLSPDELHHAILHCVAAPGAVVGVTPFAV